jgi:hypothetical protein
MARIFLIALTLSLCLITASEALAVGGDHPAGKKIARDYNHEWPKGLPDLINSGDRVWGHWINQGEFFYYRGDAAALNKFLASFGKLPNTPLAVVLHAGAKPLTGPLGGEQTTPYDWQLEVARRGWGAPLDPRQPEKEPGYVVTVHVWLGDPITLSRLDIPKHVEVRSAGDIERFINTHREPAR